MQAQDPWKYVSNAAQWGGIRLGTLDYPQPMGGASTRVAFVDTGAGLTYTVALARGGDIVDAKYKGRSLAWHATRDAMPGSFAYHEGLDWLRSWPGGLVTTCGPIHIGAPRDNTANAEGLHGHHSHTLASVTRVVNPSPPDASLAFSISMTITDTSVFDPQLRTERTISGTVGEPRIVLRDVVRNVGNTACTHQQLYHCNFGYPLVAPGSRLVIGGRLLTAWGTLEGETAWDTVKQVPDVLDEHRGAGERGFILQSRPDDNLVGIVNPERDLAASVRYDGQAMNKLAVWQHFGWGSYVCGLEPFHGSLLDADRLDEDDVKLEAGEERSYEVLIEATDEVAGIQGLLDADAQIVDA